MIRLTIYGEPASKANSRRAVYLNGHIRFIKSAKAMDYLKNFAKQLLQLPPLAPIFGDVAVTMHVYYRTRKPDLDESLILDALQGAAYVNDRQVKEKHIFHHLDKNRPRTEILVAPMARP